MRRSIIAITSATICGLTAGCMGGAEHDIDPDLPTYAERRAMDEATVSNMVARFNIEGQATYNNFPSSGTANYSGILDMEIVNTADEAINLVGDMTATVDFGARKVTGTITNFQDNNDVYRDGTLSMQSTGFTNTQDPNHVVNFNKEFEGSVTLPEGELAIVATGAPGDFTGLDSNYMAGEAYGNATLDGVLSGTVEIDYAVTRE